MNVIEDWDKMVQIVKDQKATVEEILKYAYQQSTIPDITQKIMFFNQALNNYKFEKNTLSYLSGLIDEINLEKDATLST